MHSRSLPSKSQLHFSVSCIEWSFPAQKRVFYYCHSLQFVSRPSSLHLHFASPRFFRRNALLRFTSNFSQKWQFFLLHFESSLPASLLHHPPLAKCVVFMGLSQAGILLQCSGNILFCLNQTPDFSSELRDHIGSTMHSRYLHICIDSAFCFYVDSGVWL